MTTQTSKGVSLKLERTLSAPADTVFRALTEPAELARWYGPSDEYTVEVHTWDCQPGGQYRISMKHVGGNVHTVGGEFREVRPGRRLSYTWAWEQQPPLDTLVVFDLAPAGAGTRLTLTHSGFPSTEVSGEHQKGWTGCLDRLMQAVAG